MADDLEAFLRQAAQRRAQRATAAPRPAAPGPPIPPRAPLTPPPPKSAPTKPAPPKPVVADMASPPELTRLGTRVNTAGLEQRAEHLGEEVALADEHMEAHLAQKFDHQVGSKGLSESTDATASAVVLAFDSETLAAMLANPTSLRHAILLSEILARPRFD